MMKYLFTALVLAAVATVYLIAKESEANPCTRVVSPGANLNSAVQAIPRGGVLCLNPGTYRMTTTFVVPEGRFVEGLGANRDDTRIYSTALRGAFLYSDTVLRNLLIEGPGSDVNLNQYGIMIYQRRNVLVGEVHVRGFLISIGINGSTGIDVDDVLTDRNGRNNSKADPNIWIYGSSDVEFYEGTITGRANGPSGDGELAAYDSNNVRINGTRVVDSGASAIYLVNCDSCRVENARIIRAGEWGLDIVRGSDNFVANNNYIEASWWGGSIFDDPENVGGSYSTNRFVSNNRRKWTRVCNGINIRYPGSAGGVTMRYNTVDTGSLYCIF